MAQKIEIINNTDNFSFWLETSDGRKLNVPYKYDNRIDLENLVLYGYKETDFYPEINELVAKGIVKFAYPYKQVNYNFKTHRNKINVETIIKFFKKNGFNVTKEAILHNFNAYLCDMKSGYRDDVNDYHLFTPCGCNPLSFRLTSLNKNCDWQETYSC